MPRTDLLERLEAGKTRPLALVSAPAGYGKSLLVGSWFESCGWASAWFSLDEGDGERPQACKGAKVTLSMDHRAGALRIRVQDDGNGFDPLELAKRPGGEGAFGLCTIRERMADLGGSLDLL